MINTFEILQFLLDIKAKMGSKERIMEFWKAAKNHYSQFSCVNKTAITYIELLLYFVWQVDFWSWN